MLKTLSFLAALTLGACTNPSHKQSASQPAEFASRPTDTEFIPLDTAQKMTASYVSSLDSTEYDTLHGWSIDADALRSYLANTNIKSVNISLAHTQVYMNSGRQGVPSALSPYALTIVLTGANEMGNPIYYESNQVLNRAKPCPPICLSITTTTSPAPTR